MQVAPIVVVSKRIATLLLSICAHTSKTFCQNFLPVGFIEKIRPLYYTNKGGIISEKWCYSRSNLNTRKVEALGGHLFVPGQVGDADIKKTYTAPRPD